MAHFLIEQFFKKQNIDPNELTEEEKKSFDDWQKRLVAQPITMESLTEFIEQQKEKMENKLADPSIPREERLEFLPYLTIYKALLGIINGPKVAKEQTEKYLKQLLNQ